MSIVDAELKIIRLVNLLNSPGGLNIEATVVCSPIDTLNTQPRFSVELTGEDTPLLLCNEGALLQAIQNVAEGVLRLKPEDTNRLWFDAAHAKADLRNELEHQALAGIQAVKTTSKAYQFRPMRSCERRLLHLILASSGLRSASTGFGNSRSVVLYPEGAISAEQAGSPDDSGPHQPTTAAA